MPDRADQPAPSTDRLDAVRRWADASFDPDAALVWNPPGSLDDEGIAPRTLHQVPQSAWYLLDLLERGDAETAARIADALLDLQYDDPGTPWDGTFARFLEWPHPGDGAVEWDDYDPNWRQFVGISFALALRHHRSLLGAELAGRLEASIGRAVAGEQAAGRLHWHYTNIALQHAWLLVEAGEVEAGEALAEDIWSHWREHRSFPEYNSPTYDGVDLWALALWRGHSGSAMLRGRGSELEQGLWKTVADRFHADLANIAGPYTRAYGLDSERYVAKAAVVMDVAGITDPPLPPTLTSASHSHDLLSIPALRLAPPRLPDTAREHLERFVGERLVHEVITTWPTRRESSAWLGDDLMIGAEHGDSNWSGWYQFVAGTVHWRRGDGSVGVLRYVPDGPPLGTAEPGVIRVDGPGRLEVHEPEPDGVGHSTHAAAGDRGVWSLPDGRTHLDGLDVTVTPEGDGFVAAFETATP
jgi:hypothetical protein